MSIDSNTVTITDNTGLLAKIECAQTPAIVTPGEDHKQPTINGPIDNTWTIIFLCDRKGSPQIADDFVSTVGGGSNMYADGQDSKDTPEELNFYFEVLLTPNSGDPVTVYLAQGHQVLSNNWWFGSKNVTNISGNKATFLIGGQTVELSGSTSAFMLSKVA